MLGNMRFDIEKNLTPTEKGNLNLLIMSLRRKDLLDKVNMDGVLTRNDVKEFIDPLKNLIANCEGDAGSAPVAAVVKSILAKFEAFLK